MIFLTKDNVHLHYNLVHSTKQNAEYLLMIHAIGLDMTSWDLIFSALNEDYHIITYDLRGHGLSEEGAELHSQDILLDDLIDLLSHLGMTQVHIAGHGMGSLIGLHLAHIRPDLVKSIIAISMPILFSQDSARQLIDHRINLNTNDVIEDISSYVIPNLTLLPQESETVQKLYQSFHRMQVSKYFEYLHSFLEIHQEIFTRLSQNTHPVLVLSGDLDPVYPPFISSLVTSYLPNSRYLSIFNSSNMVFIDEPHMTAQYMKEFISEASKSDYTLPQPVTDPFLQNLHNELKETVKSIHTKHLNRSLTINCINGFQVFLDGYEITNGWNKRFSKELLLYFIFHRSAAKETLCEDIWGVDESVRARANLRVYYSFLRKLLNEQTENHFLSSDHTHIRLEGHVECDLLDFISLLQTATDATDIETKKELSKQLFTRVNSSFLTCCYQDWFLLIVNKIEEQLIELAAQLTAHYKEQKDFLEAIECLKWLVLLKPEDNKIYKEIIELYGLSKLPQEAAKWERKRIQAYLESR